LAGGDAAPKRQAAAPATLLVVDAWLDVMTSPPGRRLESGVLAVFLERALASVCAWLSFRTQQLTGG
jgi:hypothetical protein